MIRRTAGARARAGLATAVAGTLVAIAACSSVAPGGRGELVVLGAASLGDVLIDAAADWEASNPDLEVVVATDSSAALRARIEEGAPADVFLSADDVNPARLAAAGLTAGPVVAFARNGLAVVTPRADPAISSAWDLARPGLRLVAAGPEVPITGYAAELVDRLAEHPDAPDGFADAVQRNVVSREDNVRAVLAKVALGEGDAAIVYATDARGEDDVATVALPPGIDVAATYAGTVVATTPHPEEARAFLDWLATGDGQAILAAAGFLSPTP